MGDFGFPTVVRVDAEKLRDHCLDPNHSRGRHKARVLRSSLGITGDDAPWLRERILGGIGGAEKHEVKRDRFGTHFRADFVVERQARAVVLRTVWIVEPDTRLALMVSCWAK